MPENETPVESTPAESTPVETHETPAEESPRMGLRIDERTGRKVVETILAERRQKSRRKPNRQSNHRQKNRQQNNHRFSSRKFRRRSSIRLPSFPLLFRWGRWTRARYRLNISAVPCHEAAECSETIAAEERS